MVYCVYGTEEALLRQVNELRLARQDAEQERDELMLRTQQLQNKANDNAASGRLIYTVSQKRDLYTFAHNFGRC